MVNYQPGVLKAIALKNGKAVDSVELTTAGKPARIRLTADQPRIKALPGNLVYVTAEVLDEKGQLVPNASHLVHFSISGPAGIIATGNADPTGMESMQQPKHKTFQGKCLIIVRPKSVGKIKLKATGENLRDGEVVIEAGN